MKLRELERRVTALIATSEGGHRPLGRKLDWFISGWEYTKKKLTMEVSAALRRIGVDRNSADVATAESIGVASVGVSHHSERHLSKLVRNNEAQGSTFEWRFH